jgi:hypothetical protein
MASTATRPQTRSTRATLEVLAQAMRDEAQEATVAYPQYLGHWDGWRVVEITESVRTKLGQAFEPGDLALRRPGQCHGDAGFVTCYSRRNGVNTSVPTTSIREIFIVGECQRCGQRVVPGNEIPDPELECPTVRRPKPKPRVKTAAR